MLFFTIRVFQSSYYLLNQFAPPLYVVVTSCPRSVFVNVVRQSQFKIRFKLQDWLWLSVVPSEFLPTRNLAFNGALPCCLT